MEPLAEAASLDHCLMWLAALRDAFPDKHWLLGIGGTMAALSKLLRHQYRCRLGSVVSAERTLPPVLVTITLLEAWAGK
jgi:hypothetical protein